MKTLLAFLISTIPLLAQAGGGFYPPGSVGNGVTSITAGTGISVNQATGSVTVTNTSPGASPAGSTGACQFYATSSTFGGDATVCLENLTALSTPGAPTVTNSGTPGMATYGYTVQACVLSGCTVGSAETQTATGNATLSAMNFNHVATLAVPGSTSCQVYRTSSPVEYGWIGSVACGSALDDIGQYPVAAGYSIFSPAGYSVGLGISRLQLGNFPSGGFWPNNTAALNVAQLNTSYPGGGGGGAQVSITDNYTADHTANEARAFSTEYIISGTFDHEPSSSISGAIELDFTGHIDVARAGFFEANNGNDQGGAAVNQLIGVGGIAANFGGTTALGIGVYGRAARFGGGTITNGAGHYADSAVNISGISAGFWSADQSSAGGTLNASFYSETAAAAGAWAFYGAGTAASKFGGTVEAVGALSVSTGSPIGSANAAICWKTTTTLSYCESAVGVGGTCTCH